MEDVVPAEIDEPERSPVTVEASWARNTLLVAGLSGLLAIVMLAVADFPPAAQRGPLVVGTVCIGLSALALARYGALLRRLPGQGLLRPSAEPFSPGRYLHTGFAMALLTLAYYLLLRTVGFFLLTGVFTAIGFLLLEGRVPDLRSLRRAGVFGAGTSLVLWLLFVQLLPIRLP